MKPVSATILRRLLDNGSVPVSALGQGGLLGLQSLIDAGVLAKVRVGAGSSFAVRHREAVASFACKHYPSGLNAAADVDASSTRALAIAAVRDAKRSRRGADEPVFLRAFQPATIKREPGEGLDLLAMTRSAGAAAVTLTQGASWHFAGRLGVVENLELFCNIEQIAPTLDAALYAGGRLSARVVQWLAGESMRATTLTHFGDYDPVGLAEYLRLKHACGERVTLYQPATLPALMRRFGKRSLLSGRNADLLRKLRLETDPAVRTVVTLMDETGCGLEQEALLIEGGQD